MLCKYAFLQTRLEAFERLLQTIELFMQYIVDTTERVPEYKLQ